MLQSEYQHLYDNITLENIKSMVKQPNGSVIIENYKYNGWYWGRNPDKPGLIETHEYKVYGEGWNFIYKSFGTGKLLYTENNEPTVFRLP